MGKDGSGRSAEKSPLTEHPKQLFFGRRKARPIRAARQDAMDIVLPKIQLRHSERSEESPGDPSPPARDDILDFLSTYQTTWLEIGFGNGDSLAAWHRAYPDVGFIGCEPFINGVSNLCKLIADDDLRNVRIWNEIAQPLIDALPDSSIDRIYLLNPDPWHKKRHAKRRFIQQEMLSKLARILKPGGVLTMTTDHADLSEWMLDQATMHPAFEGGASTTPPDGWLTTRYEGKGAKAGRRQVYLTFRRL
jgi:tRNA (guanine-N7-)-methyltransferase